MRRVLGILTFLCLSLFGFLPAHAGVDVRVSDNRIADILAEDS